MDIGSIFFLIGIFILVGLYITRPFLVRHALFVSPEEQTRSSLLAEKERLLSAIQELDFDYALGKIPEGEYPIQRQSLMNETVAVLKRLDALAEGNSFGNESQRVEQALANQSGAHRAVVTDASPDDELEALIAARRRERIEKAAGFCPQCGKPVQQSDRFCPKCGSPLHRDEEHVN
ncbi:MAG: zinc-ribbon domain-containing protein [Anaerolineales bacterium]